MKGNKTINITQHRCKSQRQNSFLILNRNIAYIQFRDPYTLYRIMNK